MNNTQSLTMKNIANKVGVSVATICRSFKSTNVCSLDIRNRIEQSLNDLNVNAYPLMKKNNMKNKFVIALPQYFYNVNESLIYSIQKTAQENNHQTILLSLPKFHGHKLLNYLSFRHLKGCIILDHENKFSELVSKNVPPMIFINQFISGHTCVTTDYLTACFNAIIHLIEAGHRQICFVGQTDHPQLSQTALEGYHLAHNRHNLSVTPFNQFNVAPCFTSGAELLPMLLKRVPNPTAVFCTNTDTALGIIMQAKMANIKIPQQLSLICFSDNHRLIQLTPFLTHIKLPFEQIGHYACKTLISSTQSSVTACSKTFSAELIKRQSVHYL